MVVFLQLHGTKRTVGDGKHMRFAPTRWSRVHVVLNHVWPVQRQHFEGIDTDQHTFGRPDPGVNFVLTKSFSQIVHDGGFVGVVQHD